MAMTWVAAISLGVLILGLLMAPAFDVRLSRSVTNPLEVAALFLAVALVLSNAADYSPPGRPGDAHQVLGILSGIFGGLGLFCAVIGCARYALGKGLAPAVATAAPQVEERSRTT